MPENDVVLYENIAKNLPREWEDEHIRNKIYDLHQSRRQKLVVLDDDPTGVQTVHNIFVLTQWDQELLREAFELPQHVFFILTNTRGMEASEAIRINREIAENVLAVAGRKGVWRSVCQQKRFHFKRLLSVGN